MLVALGWSELRTERLRSLLPFAVVALLGALAFAWLCDAVGEHDSVTSVDGPVSLWFAAHRSIAEGNLGLLAAKATSPVVLIGLVAITAILLRRRGFRTESTLLLGATVVAYGAGAVAKYAEHRARPSSPVNLSPESEASFPSGHVLVVATLAAIAVGLAWRHLSKVGRAGAIVVATVVIIAMALDRLVVGAHWLTDVLGSLALASVIAAVILAGYRLLQPQD